MQFGKVSPGTTNSIERATATFFQQSGRGNARTDDLLRLVYGALGRIGKPQAADRQGYAITNRSAGDIDKFERASAQIADNAIRI